MQRPPSGGGIARPGSSGFRPVTNRIPGSSYGQQAGGGASLNTAVNVQARTGAVQEGIRGGGAPAGAAATMRGGSARGGGDAAIDALAGRMVRDRSYYMSILRPRVTDLTNEIEKMMLTEKTIVESGSEVNKLSLVHKQTTEEMAKLKAQLADLNFAMEMSTSSDPDALLAEAQKLRTSNGEKRAESNKLFNQLKEVQSQAEAQRNQLKEDMDRLDHQLAAADPAAHAQYKTIRERAYRVSDQLGRQQQELRNYVGKHDSIMAALDNDIQKKKAALLSLDLIKMRTKREELNKGTSISVEEERQQLNNEIRNHSHEIETYQRRTVECNDGIGELRARLTALEDDISEYSSENMKRFQEMQEKDREAQEYIDAHPEKIRAEKAELSRLQMSITSILEIISRRQKLKENIPKPGGGSVAAQVDQMTNDQHIRETQAADAKATYARLQQQVKDKREEAENVGNLDAKITAELQAIQEKIQRERDETARYADLEALRREVEERKAQLKARKESLSKQRENAKGALHLLNKRLEAAKKQLNEDDVYSSLTAQEQRLRVVYQNFFSMDDFVRSKEKEGSYTVDKAECLRLMDGCANMLSQAQLQRKVEFGGIATAQQQQMNGPAGQNVFRL